MITNNNCCSNNVKNSMCCLHCGDEVVEKLFLVDEGYFDDSLKYRVCKLNKNNGRCIDCSRCPDNTLNK
jgi:hypothetical protein